jgi:drug/metabolite transporter (DMT)-like permease
MQASSLRANLAMCAAAILFGASVVAVRVAVRDVSPLALALVRFGQGALLLMAWLIIRSRQRLRVSRSDLPPLVFLGAILYAVFPVAFNAGLRLTEASHGSLILATSPIVTALLARIVNDERLSRRQTAGVLIGCGGVALTLVEKLGSIHESADALLGNGLMVLVAICGAVYSVYAKQLLRRYTPLTVTAYAMLFGSILLLPAVILEGHPTGAAGISGNDVALILFLGICGGAVGYYLSTYALIRLMPTEAAVYINLNPMVATILGVTLLSEMLTAEFLAGFILVLAGVLLVNWPKRQPPYLRRHWPLATASP